MDRTLRNPCIDAFGRRPLAIKNDRHLPVLEKGSYKLVELPGNTIKTEFDHESLVPHLVESLRNIKGN